MNESLPAPEVVTAVVEEALIVAVRVDVAHARLTRDERDDVVMAARLRERPDLASEADGDGDDHERSAFGDSCGFHGSIVTS